MKHTVVSVLAISALTLPSYVLKAEMPSSPMPETKMLLQTAKPVAPLQVNTTAPEPQSSEVPVLAPEAKPLATADTPAAAAQQTEEAEGLDTITLSEEKIGFRGNWVKKREWLLRAKEVNRKIQENIATCEQRRSPLLKDYTNMQTFLDGFYQDINRRLGKVQAEAQDLTDKTENATAKEAHITIEQERKIEKSIPTFEEFDERVEFQKKLQTFPEEITPIKNLDEALTKRIEKLDEELDVIHADGERAQTLYEEMWEVLDDQKAQTYFYQLKDISARIKTIRDYIDNDFTNDFAALIKKTRELVESVKDKMVDLEATFKTLQRSEQEKEQARISRQATTTSQWWFIAYPKKVINGIFSGISSVFGMIKGIFVKEKPVQPVRTPRPEVPATSTASSAQ